MALAGQKIVSKYEYVGPPADVSIRAGRRRVCIFASFLDFGRQSGGVLLSWSFHGILMEF